MVTALPFLSNRSPLIFALLDSTLHSKMFAVWFIPEDRKYKTISKSRRKRKAEAENTLFPQFEI